MSSEQKPNTQKENWRPIFLDAFEETGMVSAACKRAGIGRTLAYTERQRNEEFAVAWADVEEAVTERMEREAHRRAVEGVKRDVLYQGDKVGEELHYSDTLLIFMLKARRPEKYRETTRHEHSGPDGGPITFADLAKSVMDDAADTVES